MKSMERMVNGAAGRQLDPAISAAPAPQEKPIVNHVGLIDGVTPEAPPYVGARAWAGCDVRKEESQGP
jgi:hypothetical protein